MGRAVRLTGRTGRADRADAAIEDDCCWQSRISEIELTACIPTARGICEPAGAALDGEHAIDLEQPGRGRRDQAPTVGAEDCVPIGSSEGKNPICKGERVSSGEIDAVALG